MIRKFLFACAALSLAACGAPSDSSVGEKAAPAPRAELTAEEITIALAALPEPYSGADYEAGKRVFAQCRSCHVIEEGAGNRIGPNLHGLFGRHTAAVEDFAYSDALKGADFVWEPGHLDEWLANPRGYLPGNRMAFVGVRDETQRRDVIAYLMVETAD
jgi:cytochrome c